MTEQILRWRDLRSLIPLGRTTVWEMEREGKFPKRVILVGNRVGWKLSEVQEWIETRQRVNA